MDECRAIRGGACYAPKPVNCRLPFIVPCDDQRPDANGNCPNGYTRDRDEISQVKQKYQGFTGYETWEPQICYRRFECVPYSANEVTICYQGVQNG